MIKIDEISLPIKFTSKDITDAVCKKLHIKNNQILSFEILKQSIDARRKPNIRYICSIGVELSQDLEKKFPSLVFKKIERLLQYPQKKSDKTFVVVGFGPSGMFAALTLSRMGLKPIIIEQGKQVSERTKDVENLWNNRVLDKYSNVQFGEGGAGTFSDGKLNTNLNNEYCKIVLNELYNFGAPKEICYINKPHIGSDKLKQVVVNIRQEILSLGGKFLFSTRLKDIKQENGKLNAITLEEVYTKKETSLKVDYLLLCVGHSARETFEMLNSHGIKIKQKPFAMGVRIEQLQSDINLSQYGSRHIDGLPNADYKLVTHLPNGRSVFTFCMCPGGEVVLSSSNDGEVVTNGMSYFARDKENANSALLVNVIPSDYGADHPLAGIYFQQEYEKKAFTLGGGNFNAPAQTVKDFLSSTSRDSLLTDNQTSTRIEPSYKPNITMCDIQKCLPDFVVDSLKTALPILNNKLKNFARPENLLIAIESRSSCPLTIVRDSSYQSSIMGIYPIGEGAGYAGGIMSSAQDGIKVAESIYESL